MSFRKRNIGISGPSGSTGRALPAILADDSAVSGNLVRRDGPLTAKPLRQPGVRPSPLDGRPTTSTGTQSLDSLLAGHAGLALGNSILLEESGTTDYAGTLLRYFAAEGVVQGHNVLVVGAGEHWGRELPGLAEGRTDDKGNVVERKEKMKIAWRYERLGEFGAGNHGSRAFSTPEREPSVPACGGEAPVGPKAFCHSFDLTKRLDLPRPDSIGFIPIRPLNPQASLFPSVIQSISKHLSSSKADTMHRLIIPSLLSPAVYPSHASDPQQILRFLHSLRSLLRQYPNRLVIMLSLPLTLYPRSTGLTRWMELLSDGVIEFVPFPHAIDTGPSLTTSGAATAQEDKFQGMVKVHRLPVFHECGGGGLGSVGLDDDLAFTVSRRKFVIKPFSLPPVEGDTEAQKPDHGLDHRSSKPKLVDIDF